MHFKTARKEMQNISSKEQIENIFINHFLSFTASLIIIFLVYPGDK
jgi:hypothetical protein